MKRKQIIYFAALISLICLILGGVSYPVNAEEERDEYGLPIRYSGDDKPSWYPTDVESFQWYQDSEIPRVVDIADIFTEEEEKALADKIAKGSYGIQYLDYKVLSQILRETELGKIPC